MLALAIGAMMGVFLALADFISKWAAGRFNHGSRNLDSTIRRTVFGVIVVGPVILVGVNFGPLVRQHPYWLFGAMCIAFFALWLLFTLLGSHSGGNDR
ncbi:MAG: hypothetical protein EON54_19755 [Alcaligenaceae bacterium]|nr:MAG: hypothetical protein EON54_19755 [Alcaligenaceae bacterium]